MSFIRNQCILWLAAFWLSVNLTQAQELTRAQAWFHLDLKTDELAGTSALKVYQERFGQTRPFEVIVAIIDDGVDTDHEDLKGILWVNTGEIPGNGIDDDRNGYIDDVHGWSFLSGPGGEVDHDTYELVREIRRLQAAGKLSKADAAYLKNLQAEHKKELKMWTKAFKVQKEIKEANDVFLDNVGRATANKAALEAYTPKNKLEKILKPYYIQSFDNGLSVADAEKKLLEGYKQVDGMVNYSLRLDFDPRHKVGDVYTDWDNRIYGDNRVKGPDGGHGTHVAGIVAADHDNEIGTFGIAINARIMAIRAVPNGDEHDKDVANAIRYAVDNGARIINMSFGKAYSPQQHLVREAIEYARSKDVLIVHAAGNDSKNIDVEPNFPSPYAADGSRYDHWLEVGASSFRWNEELPAEFSNYGPRTVDVFAPGHHIYATLPGNDYDFNSGTSMAAPVVTGIAAVIRGMYPELTAQQVRDIIRRSAVPYEGLVLLPGSKKKKVPFKSLCETGGVVNLEQAFEVISRLEFEGEF